MLTYADIFTGCGGLCHYFYKNTNYSGTLAVDFWPAAAKVFTSNHPNIPFELRDMYQPDDVLAVIEALREKCDVLLGGPPCQGFSTLGKRRDDDKRSTLVETFLRLSVKVKPKIIVMENVRGIASKEHKTGLPFPEFIRGLLQNEDSPSQYDIANVLINALDLGLAQTRVRWILIAVRKDINENNAVLDKIVNSINSKKVDRQLSLRDVIGDLPHIESGEGQDIQYIEDNGMKKAIFNHVAMRHSPKLLERLSYVPVGGGLLDVPQHLLTNHLRKMVQGQYGNGGHIKNIYGRLDWNKPSGTIVAGIDKITCGRYVHPDSNRLLTPRECARIQSFPDDFRFFGSLVNQYYLIGNAVPPAISLILSEAIADALLSNGSIPNFV